MKIFPAEFMDSEKVAIESKSETVYSKYSMNIQTAQYGSPHQWVIEITTPPMDPRTAMRFNAFINSIGGRHELVALTSPLPFYGEGLGDLSATGLKGDTSVAISTSRSGTPILAGTFFKFDNHDKIYQCSEDYLIGNDLTFYPPLRADVTGAEVEDAVFVTRLNSDTNVYSQDAKKYVVTQTVELEENV